MKANQIINNKNLSKKQASQLNNRCNSINKPTSTVGRGKSITLTTQPKENLYSDSMIHLYYGDSLLLYKNWNRPKVIISDGAYGILGFQGDTSNHIDIPNWYEPHVKKWAKFALPDTTLWFWNSEIGWAAAHPVLEKYGWRYVSCNIWSKGKGHIAGNVNTKKIRRFPVVTEVCVQYVREPQINNLSLKQWLRSEWLRTGIPLKRANDACKVKNAATRKYFDQGHLWYFPPKDAFEMLQSYANKYGKKSGFPYYSVDGIRPISGEEWVRFRSIFNCPYGYTNVWERSTVRGTERVTLKGKKKAVHLNQKPLDLMRLLIETTSLPGDVIWEPFGGLFSASLAAKSLKRRAFAAELDSTYFQYGVQRFKQGILL